MNFFIWLWGRLFGVPPPPPPPPPPPAPPPAPPPPGQPWRPEMLALVNQARAGRAPPLTMTRELNRAAQAQAERMARAGQLFHGSTDEVIGEGQRTPAEIIGGWLSSRVGHRERLLDPAYQTVGWGRALGRNGLWYWCGDFST